MLYKQRELEVTAGCKNGKTAKALQGVPLDPLCADRSIPADEWAQVVSDADAFWDEIAAASPRSAKVVQAFKDYKANMEAAGYPYR